MIRWGDIKKQERAMDETKMTAMPVNAQTLTELTRILQKYKAGKTSIERRTVAAENWWKLRNQAEERKKTEGIGGFQAVSGWLHNVIVSKHADAIEAFPEPSILPREEGDKTEAGILSKIIPVILEQNEFEKTYSDCMWQKLKTGTGVYKIYWDADKLGGLGDIAIERVDLLNVFWEPGVRDIQDSRYFFHTSLEDNDELERQYPQLYSAAYSRYKSEGEALSEKYAMAVKRGESEYNRYRDRLSDAKAQQELGYKLEQQDYERQQKAFQTLMSLISSTGYEANEDDLKQSGMSQAQADAIRNEFLRKNGLLDTGGTSSGAWYGGYASKEQTKLDANEKKSSSGKNRRT